MAKPNSKPKSCAKQPTIAAMWGQQHKLPQSVIGVDEKVVHKMNKAVMNKSAKNGKREKYSNQYLASKYKIRRKLTIKKHNIKPCNQMNADETNLPIVPNNAWTMDEKGSKHVEGEKLDDKRNVTGMCGGARTGEAIPLQYIARGTTTRCEPRLKPVPENMRFDHTHNSWSEPESILRYLKHHVVPFTKNQCKKYDLVYDDEHFLMCWDIHYPKRRRK
eukprot:752860_1